MVLALEISDSWKKVTKRFLNTCCIQVYIERPLASYWLGWLTERDPFRPQLKRAGTSMLTVEEFHSEAGEINYIQMNILKEYFDIYIVRSFGKVCPKISCFQCLNEFLRLIIKLIFLKTFLSECQIRRKTWINTFGFISLKRKKILCAQFLMTPSQNFLQDIKKSFDDNHLDVKSIKFHLPHYEILQILSHYCIPVLILFPCFVLHPSVIVIIGSWRFCKQHSWNIGKLHESMLSFINNIASWFELFTNTLPLSLIVYCLILKLTLKNKQFLNGLVSNHGYLELSGHQGGKGGAHRQAYANLWFMKINLFKTLRK